MIQNGKKMTLGDIFASISAIPDGLLWFLVCIPLLTFLISIWQSPSVPPQQNSARFLRSNGIFSQYSRHFCDYFERLFIPF